MSQEYGSQQQTNLSFVSQKFSPQFRKNVLGSLEYYPENTFILSFGLDCEMKLVISGKWSLENGNSKYAIDNQVYHNDEFIIFVQSKYAKFLLEEIAYPESDPWVPPPPPQASYASGQWVPSPPPPTHCESGQWVPSPPPPTHCASGQWVPPPPPPTHCASGQWVPPPPPQVSCAQVAQPDKSLQETNVTIQDVRHYLDENEMRRWSVSLSHPTKGEITLSGGWFDNTNRGTEFLYSFDSDSKTIFFKFEPRGQCKKFIDEVNRRLNSAE